MGRENISRPPLTRNKITFYKNCISTPAPRGRKNPFQHQIATPKGGAPHYLRNTELKKHTNVGMYGHIYLVDPSYVVTDIS